MSAYDVLARAVLALAPAGTLLGEIPDETPLPWRSMRVSVPGVSERSEASPPQAFVVRVSLLISAATDTGALRLAGEATDALEGRRPEVPGWLCGPLLSRGSSQPYTTSVTVQQANTRLVSVPLSFEFAAARLPEE